jgi:integrase
VPSLRKRILKSGTVVWDIRYSVRGKQHSHHIGETDRRTAEKIFHKFCNSFAEGKSDGTRSPLDQAGSNNTPMMVPTLKDLAEHARVYAVSNKSPKTLEREQLSFADLIRFFGNIPLSELTPAKVELFKAERLKSVTPSTVNICVRQLNTAFSQAVALGWLDPSIQQRFKQIRVPEAEPPLWLNDDEVTLVLSTPDTEFRNFLVFLLHTGCRRNEALGLTWGDIDLERRQIMVRGTVGKMGKRRTIPVSEILFEALSNWHAERKGHLFPSYRSNQISMKFRHWAKRIGLREGISLHSMRATFASVLIQKGVDIYTVSKLLGHSSVKVTERHYIALDAKHVRSAVDLLSFK